jgi:tripartite-type tricarboxylate transporter receptor subunit TctC
MMRKCSWVFAGVFALVLMFPSGAPAAGFPERDITLVVPWAAGGGTDTLARTLVKNGKKYFGVNINVVNRVGGTGVVGMDSVAKAKPDGYTVGVITFNLSTYRLLGQSDLSYRDFSLIALLNRSIAGLSVKADSQFKTLKDLVEYARANPGVVTVGHSGPAGAWHLAAVGIAHKHGVKFTFVPFDGAAPTRTALVGGHITVCSSGWTRCFNSTRPSRSASWRPTARPATRPSRTCPPWPRPVTPSITRSSTGAAWGLPRAFRPRS